MATPVQLQYQELKSQHPEAILFFQLGDFYEMFHEDAQLCSRVLGLSLTARHKGTENEMPMCGMPRHAATEYIEKLVSAGYRVSVADQVQEGEKIYRKITRVVSPGATVEEGTLKSDAPSFLAAVVVSKSQEFFLSVADLSTGVFTMTSFADEVSFFDELYKIHPREILLPNTLFANETFCKKLPPCLHTPRPEQTVKKSQEILRDHFRVKTIDSFEFCAPEDHIAPAIILEFLKNTQSGELAHFQKLVRTKSDEGMILDRQTMTHLEIFQCLDPTQKKGTLLSVFESPKTALGARRLRSFLANPLRNYSEIALRQEAVAECFENPEFLQKSQEFLKEVFDLERLLARLSVNRGNARDLVFLRQSFRVFPKLLTLCKQAKSQKFLGNAEAFEGFEELFERLEKALVENPPLEITAGGMIQNGYNAELDELFFLRKSADTWMDQFLAARKKESGIDKLKLKYSKAFGFCLEAPKMAAKNAPASWTRRQTLVNAERFTTPELLEYEERVLSAESRAFELEHKLFLELREYVMASSEKIQKAAKAIAEIDVFSCLASTAKRWKWSRPEIQEKSQEFLVKNGRHPVVEKMLEEPFIANGVHMNEKSAFHLITGPNMAGKSTYLRQNALIILLAQIGSFVPAEKVKMGIFDRIFTRVGASDNVSAGKSTFFMEMSETARILNAATEKSFIILDEIGRGTSTFDGISIAWAITEYLHNVVKAKTLFATHYHEMIDCIDRLDSAENYHVSVTQTDEGIVFLRKILKGGISDSFGIEVAALTGFPKSVIARSREVLAELESHEPAGGQPSLFSYSNRSALENPESQALGIKEEKPNENHLESSLQKFLRKVDPDTLSPKEALEVVYEMKKREKNS